MNYYTPELERLTWNMAYSIILSDKEYWEMAAKKNRPALKWDGIKPLPYAWQLYSKGELIENVAAYDVEAGYFNARLEENNGLLKSYNQSFLVKRLN